MISRSNFNTIKIRPFILFCLLCLGFFSYSQESDTINYNQKFEFKKYKNGKIKKVKSGTYITVYLDTQDTTHSQSGYLLNVRDSVLTVNMYHEQFSMDHYSDTEENSYRVDYTYDTFKRISIPIGSIDYLQLDHGFLPGRLSDVFAVTGVISALTALFIAPLVSIDKNSPYNFNSKRYTRVIVPALIGTAVGWTVYATIGRNRGTKLKL